MRIVGLFCIFLSASFYVYGQSCDCPAANTCFTCQGGIKTLTLRYNGGTPQTVTAADNQGTVFSQVVNPGATFSFSGSLPNDKFVGSTVDLAVAGTPNATIPSNCGTVFVGNVYGSFVVVAADSKNGGPLCCSAATQDATPPMISNCPANMSVTLPASACNVQGGWSPPSATDNCTLASFTSTHNPTDVLTIGITTVTYTAVDSYNNQSTCSFTVTVTDATNPVITGCPGDITLEASGSCQAVATWTVPTASDNCSATISTTHTPGTAFSLGTTVVTYTAKDPTGNTTTCTFNVIVKDTTAPVITGCPANITLAITGCETIATWTPPTVEDKCDFSIEASHDPGDVFALGVTKVTYTATDDLGNTSTCSFNVTITTNATPAITGCPNDITLHTFEDAIEVTWEEPQATAVCGDLSSTASHQPGEQFGVGVTEVVYEFTDGTKNKSTCRFNVTVIKDEFALQVSKAVTPNDDGVNDTWTLTNIEKFLDNTVTVVDRWGNRIYHSSGYDNTNVLWNGVGPGGSKVPVGTYFYTIEVRMSDKFIRDSGFVEVIY